MITVNIHEAKTHLSKLIEQAVQGETFIIAQAGLGRGDFRVDPRVLRRGLLDNGYLELPVTSQRAVGLDGLPLLHKDPFDRMLVSQAIAEGITLLSGDARLAESPGPIRTV